MGETLLPSCRSMVPMLYDVMRQREKVVGARRREERWGEALSSTEREVRCTWAARLARASS